MFNRHFLRAHGKNDSKLFLSSSENRYFNHRRVEAFNPLEEKNEATYVSVDERKQLMRALD